MDLFTALIEYQAVFHYFFRVKPAKAVRTFDVGKLNQMGLPEQMADTLPERQCLRSTHVQFAFCDKFRRCQNLVFYPPVNPVNSFFFGGGCQEEIGHPKIQGFYSWWLVPVSKWTVNLVTNQGHDASPIISNFPPCAA